MISSRSTIGAVEPTRGAEHRRPLGRALAVGTVLVTLLSVVVTQAAMPEGVRFSSDPTVAPVPLWTLLLPSLAGILLTLNLPRRQDPMPATTERRGQLLLSTGALLVLYLVFTVGVGVVPWQNEDYILAKAVLFIVLPGVVVAMIRHSVDLRTRSAAWRWWAPAVVVLLWFVLSELAPWNPPYNPGAVDPTYLLVAAAATAITAGFGEELFFRRWLQTRMEALLGGWAGIGVTSLLFGLMHLGSHGTGVVWLDVAQVIAIQGTFGWLVGIMWWRYRNLTMIIVVHLLSNGWGVVQYLAGR